MTHDDVSSRAVAAIRTRLMADPEWSIDLPDGFAWWASDIRQEITARLEVGASGDPRARVLIRTELVRDVTATGAHLVHLVTAANARPLGGAARVLPDGRLVIEATFPAADETIGRIVHAAATVATLALTVGRDVVGSALNELGGSIARSHHPTSGWRQSPDQMLDLPLQFPLIATQLEAQGGPNPWSIPDEWEHTARTVTNMGIGVSMPGDASLTAQFPLRDLASGPGPVEMLRNETPTALLRGDWLSDTTLRSGLTLGPGVLLRLFLPASSYPGYDSLDEVAAALNDAEIDRGGAPNDVWPAHYGAWTLQPSMNRDLLVAYVLWTPAMLATRISHTDLVIQQAFRTRNAVRWLAVGRGH